MSSRNAKLISQIAIIGVGQVGAAAAYALILQSVARELLLVDVKMDLRDGQARDLSDVCYSCNSETRVRAATHQEASQSDIVVITVGSKYSTGKKWNRDGAFDAGLMAWYLMVTQVKLAFNTCTRRSRLFEVLST
jgi:malate/lactate dehydrogenase